MSLLEPTEAELRRIGSLKWTGITAMDGAATMGAWVAEMDFGTAPVVSERLVKSIREGLLGYRPDWAADGAIEALCQFQESRFGWVISPHDVRIAESILNALQATIATLTRPGSQVVVPTPAYMPFLTIPGMFDREVIQVPSHHRPSSEGTDAWSLDLDGIRRGLEAGAGLVMLCNPWNPTGRVLTVEELRSLHDLVCQYDALVFSDEIHSPLVFGDPSQFVSYASLGPSYAAHTVTAVAASKGWNIAGLPAAQVVLPDKALRERWDREATMITRGATALGLVGAITAYREGVEWLDEVLERLSRNLDLLDEALGGTAVDYSRPQGTYLTWLGWDAYDLEASPMTLLRDQTRVAVNEGSTLGKHYPQWTRVNAAMSPIPWERTVDRIASFAADHS